MLTERMWNVTCCLCAAQWTHQSGRQLSIKDRPEREPNAARAMDLTGTSAFELSLEMVRRLVDEHQATVLDYDVTPSGGVINLRVTAPTDMRRRWSAARTQYLIEMAWALHSQGERICADISETSSERIGLLMETRERRSSLQHMLSDTRTAATRLSDACRASSLPAWTGRPAVPAKTPMGA